MTEALHDLWRTLIVVAPKVLLFAAFLAVGFLIGKIVSQIVVKLLLRVGFNRLMDKAGLDKALKGNGASIVGKLVYYAIVLVFAQLAFGVFGPNPISALLTSVIAFLPRLFVAVALVVVATFIASAVRGLLENAIGGLSYGKVVSTIASAFIIGLGVIAALGQVGVALTVTLPVLVAALATAGGVLVVGVGGGLIKPMQERWEKYLTAAEDEGNRLRGGATEVDSHRVTEDEGYLHPAD